MDEIGKVLAAARESRLVIFAGAGVSMGAPTNLPSWRDVNRIVVRALATNAASAVSPAAATHAADLILARHAQEKLPPEYQAQVLAEFLHDRYFEVLRHLDSDRPNATHLAIAWLARLGCVRAVITTNFDRVIEAAFAAVDTPLDRFYLPDDFRALAADLQGRPKGNRNCLLLKLHGSVDDPTTLIDTLAQRKKGFAAPVMACARLLLHSSHWLFLGFSGLDLEAEENYLGLRQEAEHAVGFTWFLRTATAPRPAVSRLRESYGNRGGFVSGDLPDWLLGVTAHLSADPARWIDAYLRRSPPADATANTVALERGAAAWAYGLTPTVSALCLAFVVIACAEPQSAADLVARVLKAIDGQRKPAGSLGGANALLKSVAANALGTLLAALSRHAEAVHWLSIAVELAEATDDETADRWRGNLAVSLESLGRVDEAYAAYRSALDGYRRRADPATLAFGLTNLASYLIRQMRLDEAHTATDEAIACARTAGDEKLRGTALNDLGLIAKLQEDYPSALAIFEEVETLFSRLGNDEAAADAAGNRAEVLAALGRFDEAERIQLGVLQVHERQGRRETLAAGYLSMGTLELHRGNAAAAESWYQRARSLYRELGDPLQEAFALVRLASVKADGRCFAEALALAESALPLVEGRNAAFTSDVWGQIGRASLHLGRLPRAEAAYRAVCKFTAGVGATRLLAAATMNLGTVLLLRQSDEDAALAFARAAQLWEQLGDQDNVEYCTLGEAAVRLDARIAALSTAGHAAPDPEAQRAMAREMVPLYPELIAMYKKLQAMPLVAEFCASAASTAAFVGEVRTAVAWHREAAKVFQEIGSPTRARRELEAGEGLLQRNVNHLLRKQSMAAALPGLLELAEVAEQLGHAQTQADALLNAAISLLQVSVDFKGAKALAQGVLALTPADGSDAATARKLVAYCDGKLKTA